MKRWLNANRRGSITSSDLWQTALTSSTILYTIYHCCWCYLCWCWWCRHYMSWVSCRKSQTVSFTLLSLSSLLRMRMFIIILTVLLFTITLIGVFCRTLMWSCRLAHGKGRIAWVWRCCSVWLCCHLSCNLCHRDELLCVTFCIIMYFVWRSVLQDICWSLCVSTISVTCSIYIVVVICITYIVTLKCLLIVSVKWWILLL